MKNTGISPGILHVFSIRHVLLLGGTGGYPRLVEGHLHIVMLNVEIQHLLLQFFQFQLRAA